MVIIEIRPGEGGADAETFASELASAFAAYARKRNVTTKIRKGRTIILELDDDLDLERYTGTHRIQRIPKNDARGRRHTSTATVALLDAPASVAVEVDDADIEFQVYRGSGKGGQHRNVTDSAVRAIHQPTGIVVEMEHGRSQWQNKEWARNEISSRLREQAQRRADRRRNQTRSKQFTSGERPVKQWTWNDQRSEVVDHSTGKRYPMKDFLRGRLR